MKRLAPLIFVVLIALVLLVTTSNSPDAASYVPLKGKIIMSPSVKLPTVTLGDTAASTAASQCLGTRMEFYTSCCKPACIDLCNKGEECSSRCNHRCIDYLTKIYQLRKAKPYPAIGNVATDEVYGARLGETVALKVVEEKGDQVMCKSYCVEECPRRASWWPKKFECKIACKDKCIEYISWVEEEFGRLWQNN